MPLQAEVFNQEATTVSKHSAQYIKQGKITENHWCRFEGDTIDSLPKSPVLVPLALWLENRSTLQNRVDSIGIWLDSSDTLAETGLKKEDIASLPVIAINFPVFADGRGFSTARLLREALAYQGEVRAIGNILRDQLFYLNRCGFDAFEFEPDMDLEAVVTAFSDFSDSYQTACDQPTPWYRRRI